MPRCLSVSRATVAAGSEAAYLAAAGALAAARAARGQHFWVFQSPDDPRTFLEFRESRDAASHPARATLPPAEARLEAELRALAPADPAPLWDEVVLPAPPALRKE
jgi:hypothetical protein